MDLVAAIMHKLTLILQEIFGSFQAY